MEAKTQRKVIIYIFFIYRILEMSESIATYETESCVKCNNFRDQKAKIH